MSTTHTAAAAEMQELFRVGWGTESEVAWDNTKFSQSFPDGSSKQHYVKFFISHNSGRDIAYGGIGNILRRNIGFIEVQILIRKNDGVQKIYELSDKASGIFAAHVGKVWFSNFKMNNTGYAEEGHFRGDFLVDFYYDTLS